MRTKGFVLFSCLLMIALCTALVMASLQLNRLASRLNQIALTQQRPAVLLQGETQAGAAQVACLPSGQIWSTGWQQCHLVVGRQANPQLAGVGFVVEMATIVIPQGGGL